MCFFEQQWRSVAGFIRVNQLGSGFTAVTGSRNSSLLVFVFFMGLVYIEELL